MGSTREPLPHRNVQRLRLGERPACGEDAEDSSKSGKLPKTDPVGRQIASLIEIVFSRARILPGTKTHNKFAVLAAAEAVNPIGSEVFHP